VIQYPQGYITDVKYNNEPSKTGVPQNAPVGSWRAGMQGSALLLDYLQSSLFISIYHTQVWGHGPGTLMHRHRGMLNQKRLFSPAYTYKVGTSGNALKCDIILPALLLEHLESSLFISVYHTQVLGHEPGTLMHRYRGMLTQKRLFSPAYAYKVGTSDNALKCNIILPALLLDYLQSSLFISIYHTQLELQADVA
jgi:hypothetical protein